LSSGALGGDRAPQPARRLLSSWALTPNPTRRGFVQSDTWRPVATLRAGTSPTRTSRWVPRASRPNSRTPRHQSGSRCRRDTTRGYARQFVASTG